MYGYDNALVLFQVEDNYKLFIKSCNFNDNTQCSKSVLFVYDCQNATISYSNFVGNNATFLIRSDSSFIIVNNCYTDSLTTTTGSVDFEGKNILRNFQNITTLEHGICNHKQICENNTCDNPYFVCSTKLLLSLFIMYS